MEEVIHSIYDTIRDDPLNAFITLRPKEEVLKEFSENLKKPLKGLPITVKDNISTKGLRTTAGSKMLERYIPPFDATVVSRLRSAGATIIGKTNMDEFAMGSTGETSAYGPTLNPLDKSKVPGGSSSGAGAAAKGYLLPGIGSDTGGSIRAPAAWCSVYAIKPTYGLVSRYGLIPYANSLEQISPIAPTPELVELLLDIIAGHDPNDHTTLHTKMKLIGCTKKRVERVVAIEDVLEYVDPSIRTTFNTFLKKLSSNDVKVEWTRIPMLKSALPAYYVIAMSEASSNLSRYDGIRYGPIEPLEGTFYEFIKKIRRKYFGWEVKRRIALGATILSAGYKEELYLRALKVRRLIRDILLEHTQRGLLLLPTMPILPPPLKSERSPKELFSMDLLTVPSNLAGLPAGSMPIAEGIGLQAIGKPLGECEILALMGLVKELSKTKIPKWYEMMNWGA